MIAGKSEGTIHTITDTQTESVLILGVGNFLMGDEGVGVHLAQKMEKMDLPSYLKVVDGGTGGFFLMGYFDEFDKVIFFGGNTDPFDRTVSPELDAKRSD